MMGDSELAAIYVERVGTGPFAWQALREKLTDGSGLNVVIVSGLHHLAGVGHTIKVRNLLLAAGINVLVTAQGDGVGRAASEVKRTPMS